MRVKKRKMKKRARQKACPSESVRVKKRARQKACASKSVRVKKRACQRAYQKLQKQVEDFVDKRINDSSVHSNIVMFDF